MPILRYAIKGAVQFLSEFTSCTFALSLISEEIWTKDNTCSEGIINSAEAALSRRSVRSFSSLGIWMNLTSRLSIRFFTSSRYFFILSLLHSYSPLIWLVITYESQCTITFPAPAAFARSSLATYHTFDLIPFRCLYYYTSTTCMSVWGLVSVHFIHKSIKNNYVLLKYDDVTFSLTYRVIRLMNIINRVQREYKRNHHISYFLAHFFLQLFFLHRIDFHTPKCLHFSPNSRV